jgi:hypothetical protein
VLSQKLPNKHGALRHLALAIHPANSKQKFLLMLNLTSYTDETGHPDDPTLEYVGMAGFVAPFGAWEIFEAAWDDLLRNAGLAEPFHMKDFAHSQGQFKPWKGKEELRRAFIGRAVSIIVETRGTPVGAVVSMSSFRTLTEEQQSHFLDPYYLALQNCTRGAAIQAVFEPPEEKVAMVYSYNSEYGTNNGGRAEQLWHAIRQGWDHGNRMGSYASSTPAILSPLQAADLLAYELSHEFENRVKRPNDAMRWPLRQIMGMYRIPSPRMTLFDRNELLRIVKESNWPDQTGVEELERPGHKSAQSSMIDWMVERGQFTKDHYAGFFEAAVERLKTIKRVNENRRRKL